MSKTFFKMSLGLLAVAGMVWPSAAAVPGRVTLRGHVPSVIYQLTATGREPATNRLHLAIGLPLHNQAMLDALSQQIYDPSSQMYHHFLTPAEFTSQFGPTEEDYQKVINFAKTNGFTVTATSANRMILEVEARASDVERAFNVTLHTYRHPTENRTFFAPDTEPSVPANISILDVSGMNNYARPKPHLRFTSPHAANSSTATPHIGSAPGGGYIGNNFRAAYAPGTTLNGAGQNIALVQFDGYTPSDVATYEGLAGLPSVSLTNILLNGFNGVPTYTGGEVEVTLDIEMVVSMAPGLNKVLVYEGSPFNFIPNVVLNQIAVDDSARQISCSWGWTGGPNSTSDQIFQQMIVQGQTFFNASGDSDAFLPGEVDDPNFTGFPSSDPYITEVGGTTLQTAGPGGPRVNERVWNAGGGEGSSGGISSYYAIPSWQQGISMTLNQGSTTFRNIPDVALTGDNVYEFVDGVEIQDQGGTSCAAPLWAGFTALINQQAALNGKSSVGFLNPAIYSLSKTVSYIRDFNDIIVGDNTWSASPTAFFAVTNYDLCTGLGTPNGTNLINALASVSSAALPRISAPLPPWGNTLGVMNGSNPNGPWFLFVQDDKVRDIGVISSGWSVALTTANPVGYAADNQVYVTSTNSAIITNQYWNVTVAVTNYGPSFSTNVYVTDTLPVGSGIMLVSSNATIGSVSQFGSTMVWTLGNLVTNAGAMLNLKFWVSAVGNYTNNAVVAATTDDPNPDDDSAGVTLLAQPVVPPVLTLGGSATSGGFHFSVSGSPVSTIIQASTNLMTWIPIYTNTPFFMFTNFDSTNFPVRFYRAVPGP